MTDEAKATDLLSCPFCGGEALEHRSHLAARLRRVTCKNCDAGPSASLSAAEARAKWNRRARLSPGGAGGLEPVAWRLRPADGNHVWEYIAGEPEFGDESGAHGWIVQPLVSGPQAAAEIEALRARVGVLETALREVEELADLSRASPGTLTDPFDQGARAARLEARDIARQALQHKAPNS